MMATHTLKGAMSVPLSALCQPANEAREEKHQHQHQEQQQQQAE